MGRTAHLVVWLRTDAGIPSVIGCHIHSAGPMGLTLQAGVVYAEILQVTGKDFNEAHGIVMEVCRTSQHLAWTRMFLGCEGPPSLTDALRRGMRGYNTSQTEWPRPQKKE